MRRRILMAALWLAGTFGATGVVFTAVGKLSTNLSSIGDDQRRAPRLGPGATGTTTSVEPFITTTSSSTTVLDTTTVATVAETTTTSSAVDAPVDNTLGPPDTQAPTAQPTTVRTAPAATPTAPVVVTTAPVPPTAAPPTAAPPTNPPVVTTESPGTTSAPGTCTTSRRALTGRNTVVYQVCPAGVSLLQALPATGWSAVAPIVVGPPTVTVTFSNGSTTLTCTLRPFGDGLVDTSNC